MAFELTWLGYLFYGVIGIVALIVLIFAWSWIIAVIMFPLKFLMMLLGKSKVQSKKLSRNLEKRFK